jgi:hypothetical protein
MCKVPAPAVRATEAPDFMAQPIATLLQVIGLARQPFVSDVLPMYAVFIGLAPLAIRWARAQPLAFVCGSVALWIMSPTLLPLLPSSEPRGWSFNPFAWQLMFGMGLLARLRPDFVLPQQTIVRGPSPSERWWRWPAWRWRICGCVRTCMRPGCRRGCRRWSFRCRSRAWRSCAWSASWGWHGWSIWRARGMGRALARFMGPVVQIGRHSLFCFVLGAVVSVTSKVDLWLRRRTAHAARGAGGDIVAVARCWWWAAGMAAARKRRRSPPNRGRRRRIGGVGAV